MPVIAVLTKADALNLAALSQLRDEGLTMREAKSRVAELAAQMLSRLKVGIENQLSSCKYPPKAYLSMTSKWAELILYYIILTWKFCCRYEQRECRLWSTSKMHNRGS